MPALQPDFIPDPVQSFGLVADPVPPEDIETQYLIITSN